MDNINPPTQGPVLVSKPSLRDRLPKLPLFVWIFIIVGLSSLILGGFYLILSKTGILTTLFPDRNGENNISTPFKPTPKPLAHGRQRYVISGSKTGAPLISEATIDPIDPASGATQTLEVKISSRDSTPVTKAALEVVTDNKSKKVSLTLAEGTNLDGTWKGSWTMDDIYDYRYQLAVTAENANTGWSVTLTFR